MKHGKTNPRKMRHRNRAVRAIFAQRKHRKRGSIWGKHRKHLPPMGWLYQLARESKKNKNRRISEMFATMKELFLERG